MLQWIAFTTDSKSIVARYLQPFRLPAARPTKETARPPAMQTDLEMVTIKQSADEAMHSDLMAKSSQADVPSLA